MDFRAFLFSEACEINGNFRNFTENEQFVFLFSSKDLIRVLEKKPVI